MSRKSRRKDEEDKPITMRAEKLADWLEAIEDSSSMARRFKLWWHRTTIFNLALEALAELAELEKKNGCHDKVRRALNAAVIAMGGAELKWQGAAPKKDD